jgi:hypothetical protein
MNLIKTFLLTTLVLVSGCTSVQPPAPPVNVVAVQAPPTPPKPDVPPPPVVVVKAATLQFPDPHGHVVDVHALPWKTELTPDVLILKVPALDKKPHENCVTNQSQTMVAFTIFAGRNPPDWQGEHVYFQRLGANERFVILGIPMGQRDFSDLAWVNDRYLVFDRWSSPHYGMHYIFDAVQKKLLLATPFPDQFYLDQQKKDSTPTPAPPGSKQ